MDEVRYKYGKRGRPSKEARLAAVAAVEARQGKTLSDPELLKLICKSFAMMRSLTMACGRGEVPSLVVPGAPGIGKSYNITDVLDSMDVKYEHVEGGISAVELYAMAYQHRAKGNVILLTIPTWCSAMRIR